MQMTKNVLDAGRVDLQEAMGGDLSVVNAARVSFNRVSNALDEADIGVIKFMMRGKHGSPFESIVCRFYVRCPLFVAREWFRHRIGSFNEQSGRYSKLDCEFYVPQYVRTQVGKPGSYRYEPVPDNVATACRSHLEEVYDHAYREYELLLSMGIAKELARLVLPLATYTSFIWTVNARSLMNFLSLRCAETAQYEIRQYADAILEFFQAVAPHTAQAFLDGGMVAP